MLRRWFKPVEPPTEVEPKTEIDMNLKLGENFTLEEFIRSRTAIEQDIEEQFHPHSGIVDSLHKLTQNVLQPLRVEFQSWMYITSGYRCERLNKAVKGSDNSDHLRGQAADVTCKNVKQLYDLCIALDLPFKQLIYYKKRNFVHISYDENDIRKQNWEQ